MRSDNLYIKNKDVQKYIFSVGNQDPLANEIKLIKSVIYKATLKIAPFDRVFSYTKLSQNVCFFTNYNIKHQNHESLECLAL